MVVFLPLPLPLNCFTSPSSPGVRLSSPPRHLPFIWGPHLSPLYPIGEVKPPEGGLHPLLEGRKAAMIAVGFGLERSSRLIRFQPRFQASTRVEPSVPPLAANGRVADMLNNVEAPAAAREGRMRCWLHQSSHPSTREPYRGKPHKMHRRVRMVRRKVRTPIARMMPGGGWGFSEQYARGGRFLSGSTREEIVYTLLQVDNSAGTQVSARGKIGSVVSKQRVPEANHPAIVIQ